MICAMAMHPAKAFIAFAGSICEKKFHLALWEVATLRRHRFYRHSRCVPCQIYGAGAAATGAGAAAGAAGAAAATPLSLLTYTVSVGAAICLLLSMKSPSL